MSALLDRALAAAQNLPVDEQDAIAALILEEIEDERRWEETFAKSPGKLTALAARAAEQVKAGQFKAVGFDEL